MRWAVMRQQSQLLMPHSPDACYAIRAAGEESRKEQP